MRCRVKLVLALPALMLMSQPASAADDMRAASAGGAQMAAFAGLHLRLNVGKRGTVLPTARLRLSYAHLSGGARQGYQGREAPALELGIGRRGGAALFISGQRFTDLQHRLGIAPVATALFAVGALGAGAMALSELSDSEDLDEVRCFIPEKEYCGKPIPQQ